MFQQFLKLGGDALSSRDNFLVLDADTVLIRPHIFEYNDKNIFFCRSLHYKPYFKTYQRLLGEKALGPDHSIFFVSHYMFFKQKWLTELKKVIESRHNTNWYTSIMNSINKNQWDSFSEYETYGNFILKNHPEQMMLKKRLNLSMKRSSINNLLKLNIKELARRYRSISFHSWNS